MITIFNTTVLILLFKTTVIIFLMISLILLAIRMLIIITLWFIEDIKDIIDDIKE